MSESDQEKNLEEKDVSYSPGSETETEVKQDESAAGDNGPDGVNLRPGTGGPDDVGDVEVDPSELNAPNGAFPGHG